MTASKRNIGVIILALLSLFLMLADCNPEIIEDMTIVEEEKEDNHDSEQQLGTCQTYIYAQDSLGRYPDDIINSQLALEYSSSNKSDLYNLDTATILKRVFPDLYTVSVCGESQHVYKTEEPHICTFGADGTVLVEVGSTNGDVKSVVVRPVSKNYISFIKEGKAYIYLNPNDHVSIEISVGGEAGISSWSWDEGLKNGTGYITASKTSTIHPLFIFVNPLETESEKQPSVLFGPQDTARFNSITKKKSLESNDAVSLPGGYVWNGPVSIGYRDKKYNQGKSNVSVRGYGIIDARLRHVNETTGAKNYTQAFSVISSSDVSVSGVIVINKDIYSTYNSGSQRLKYSNYKVIAVFSDSNSSKSDTNPGNENDGMDFFGCCDVTVDNCFSYSHDDTFNVACRDSDFPIDSKWDILPGTQGRAKEFSSYNIVFSNCIAMNVKAGNSFSIGGNTYSSIRDIHFRNIVSLHANIGHVLPNPNYTHILAALCVKNYYPDGNVYNISYDNVVIEDAHQHPIAVVRWSNPSNSGYEEGKEPLVLYDVSFSNVECKEVSDVRDTYLYGLEKYDSLCDFSVKFSSVNCIDPIKIITGSDTPTRSEVKEPYGQLSLINCAAGSVEIDGGIVLSFNGRP